MAEGRHLYSPVAFKAAKRLRSASTGSEDRLWQALRQLKLNIRRRAPIGPYVVDFVCHAAKLVIEVDGGVHALPEVAARDLERDVWLAREGFRVMRVSSEDAHGHPHDIAQKIASAITTLPPSRGKGEEIWRILATIPDPEVPAVTIVDLGMVRSVTDDAVTITPTYTGCPATLAIQQSVRIALDDAGFTDVQVRTTIDPPWTTDWITAEGRAKLNAYGIAPPSTAPTAACPQCGSTHTEEISRFGSTPCKALWKCLDCAEPFDRFKCH